MWHILSEWYKRYFASPDAGILFFFLSLVCLAFWLFGPYLAPVLAAIVLAYLLESIITPLMTRFAMPRALAMWVVYCCFIGVGVLIILGLLPLIGRQMTQFVADIPDMLAQLSQFVDAMPTRYPDWVSQAQADSLASYLHFDSHKVLSGLKVIWNVSASSLPGLVSWLVYVILVPFLVLFFLKDKEQITAYLRGFLPARRELISRVGREMHCQLGNYVNGKAIEVILVGVATYIGFKVFHLNYALVLALAVGLSVIVPYVGMVVVTVPVVLIGLVQYGAGPTFFYMLLVFFIIQILDGNVLVPILFSGAVNLHPVAIIVAVLVFGGVWGLWGLFFAIPLATLVRAIFKAWFSEPVYVG